MRFKNREDGNHVELLALDADLATFRHDGGKASRYLGRAEFERRYQAVADSPTPSDNVGAAIVPSHCTGYSFSFEPGTLHVRKDGSGYIVVSEDDFIVEDDRCEGEHGPEGSVHWIARMGASEITALRDFLNGAKQTHAALQIDGGKRIKLNGPELWEIVFGIANDVASEITDEQYSKIAEAINNVFIDPPPQVNVEWPPLVQLGRTLGMFASAIKSGESWTETLQVEYDRANAALKSAYATLATAAEGRSDG